MATDSTDAYKQIIELVSQLSDEDRKRLAARIAVKPGDGNADAAQLPAANLGDKLRAIRKQIEESGAPLLDLEQADQELRERRGGLVEGKS